MRTRRTDGCPAAGEQESNGAYFFVTWNSWVCKGYAITNQCNTSCRLIIVMIAMQAVYDYSRGMKGLVVRDERASIIGGYMLAISTVPAGNGNSDSPFGKTLSIKPFS